MVSSCYVPSKAKLDTLGTYKEICFDFSLNIFITYKKSKSFNQNILKNDF